MKFINIGYGNIVSSGRIVAIASPESEPIKRLVRDGKDAGRVIDASCGKKTRSVIVADSSHIILSALSPEVLSARLAGDTEDEAVQED